MNTADTDDDSAVRRKHLIVKRTVMSVTVFPSQCRFDELPAREGFPMRLMALLTALASKERGPPFSGPKSLDAHRRGRTVQSQQSGKAFGAL